MKFVHVLAILSIVAIAGCVQQSDQKIPTNQTQAEQLKIQYEDSSTFLLGLADLPQDENWTLTERGERNVNDVSSKALKYNWSGGYYATFSSSQKDKVTWL